MGNITGSPKNFESGADKADRIAMSRTDGTAALPNKKTQPPLFQVGGEVEHETPLPPSPFVKTSKPKPIKPPTPTPLPPNQLNRGGHADEKADRRLFNKMFQEKKGK
jgi:hypothetical protein